MTKKYDAIMGPFEVGYLLTQLREAEGGLSSEELAVDMAPVVQRWSDLLPPLMDEPEENGDGMGSQRC